MKKEFREMLSIPVWVKEMPGYKERKRWMGYTIHKEFFDIGYGTTSMIKNLVLLLGGGSMLLTGGAATGWAALAYLTYLIGSYFFGRYFCKWGINVAEIETSNIFNPFVGEVRDSKILKGKN